MRVAIVTDIHGNLTAFEAVLSDLRRMSPDLILHGGDLADAGSSPVEIVDEIRALGWAGVYGNTDEMLFQPQSLEDFAGNPPRMPELFGAVRRSAAWTRDKLGDERIAWLSTLPLVHIEPPVALVHASPESAWRSPTQNATETELDTIYSPLGQPLAVYGHIHHPFIRPAARISVMNAGSVSLSYDGDPRASYLLIDDSTPQIRRVEYDLDREVKALLGSAMPHSEWIARSLHAASPQML